MTTPPVRTVAWYDGETLATALVANPDAQPTPQPAALTGAPGTPDQDDEEPDGHRPGDFRHRHAARPWR